VHCGNHRLCRLAVPAIQNRIAYRERHGRVWERISSTRRSGRPVAGVQSLIGNEAGKALVHVVLVVAMEQRVARMIRDEVDLRSGIARHADRILHHAGCRPVADLGELECMAVHVDRMLVAAAHSQVINSRFWRWTATLFRRPEFWTG